MKEYIERAITLDTIGVNNNRIWNEVYDIPVADVVEVVRCKDCRYYQDSKVNEKGFLICQASGMEITETDYCSYSEKKIETVLPKSDAKDESLEADHEVS